jgi:hypothetical protein
MVVQPMPGVKVRPTDNDTVCKIIINSNSIPEHFMCEFVITLHTVPLSVGLTFTAGIGCTIIDVFFAHKFIALITDKFGFLFLCSGTNVASLPLC